METYLDAMRQLLEACPDGATVYLADGSRAPAGDADAVETAELGVHLDLLFWGEYCGSIVDGANIRTLRRECPNLPWTCVRAGGWEIDSLGLNLEALKREWIDTAQVRKELRGLVDTLRGLETYSVADEDELSALESEAVYEAWRDYGLRDWLQETGWWPCSPLLSDEQTSELFELAYGSGSSGYPIVEGQGQSVHFPKAPAPDAEDVARVMFPTAFGVGEGPYLESMEEAEEWALALPRDVAAAGGPAAYVARFGGQATLGPVLRAVRYLLCDASPEDAPEGRERAAAALELVDTVRGLGVDIRG